MQEKPDIAHIAALIGERTRAGILTALLDGKALTASELARAAGVTPQTVSTHLAKLKAGGLTRTRHQGRHRYMALASAEVAGVLNGLLDLAAMRGHRRTRTGPRDPQMRLARVCYNHLAGVRGVQLFESLQRRGAFKGQGEEIALTDEGASLVQALGVDVAALSAKRAPMCKECLDWSERRTHLAGSLGRALFFRMSALGWLRRVDESRTVEFLSGGEKAFDKAFPPAA
ncbi:MAG: winged helix-turn-helix domain-containing protein [Pseudomonadota bacterium]